MTVESKTGSAPWYKHPWLWFVIFVPVFTVVFCGVMFYIASANKDPDVHDDWYKDKKAINQDLSRDNLALSLKLEANLGFDGQNVTARIGSGNPLPPGILPAEMDLTLSHPTDQARDIHVLLKLSGDQYTGQMNNLPKGRYYLELGCKNWRLKDTVSFPIASATLQAHTL